MGTGGRGGLVTVAVASDVDFSAVGVAVEVGSGGLTMADGAAVGSGMGAMSDGTGRVVGEFSGEGVADGAAAKGATIGAAFGPITPLLPIAGGGACAHPMTAINIAATAPATTGMRLSSLFCPITFGTI